MDIERFYTPGLAQIAYGVADPVTRSAAVIDPRRDVDDYLSWATDHDYVIVAILETHVHADFVSGARELAAATGAPVYAGRIGATEFVHQPLDDGDVIPVGNVRLQALWTPGHTPEHISYLLFEPPQSEKPMGLFSGDVLFAGEIGRPDLLGADSMPALVAQLYDTVTKRLPTLPDDVAVYPGHGAGSPCGKKIGDAAQTTIGQEKRFNYAFQTQSLDEFTRAVMTGMPQPPAYYPTMKRMNKVGPPLLRELPSGVALDADEIAARQAAGALLIDARPAAEFARRHIPGAVSVGLGPNFAIWCGWLAPYEREVIFVLPGDDLYPETLTELRRIGIDNVAGYLAGGIDAWSASGRPTGSLAEMSVSQLAARIEHPRNGLTVVDVRDATEWEGGHIPGARNVPAGALAQGTPAAIEEHATVAVICGSGYRSAVAASLLKAGGLQDVITVPGGMEAWSAAGNPLA